MNVVSLQIVIADVTTLQYRSLVSGLACVPCCRLPPRTLAYPAHSSSRMQYGRLVLYQLLCERQDLRRHDRRARLAMGLWYLCFMLHPRSHSHCKSFRD